MKPIPITYPVIVNGEIGTMSVTDYGPVAHVVIYLDSFDDTPPDIDVPGVDLESLFAAFYDVFYKSINKPCVVQVPWQTVLVWSEGPIMRFSFHTLYPEYGDPYSDRMDQTKKWPSQEDAPERGKEAPTNVEPKI